MLQVRETVQLTDTYKRAMYRIERLPNDHLVIHCSLLDLIVGSGDIAMSFEVAIPVLKYELVTSHEALTHDE